jgi:hypothetical protein
MARREVSEWSPILDFMTPEPDRWTVSAEDAWRLLTEPMDEAEARTAADAITAAIPHVQALPIDPRQWLVLAWDRSDVAMFVEALSMLAAADRPVPSGLLNTLRDWLTTAEPGPSGYEWPSPQ